MLKSLNKGQNFRFGVVFTTMADVCLQALDTLSAVAPLCLDDYMTCQSNTRLLMLLEWCVGQGKLAPLFSSCSICLVNTTEYTSPVSTKECTHDLAQRYSPHQKTLERVGTSSGCGDFWDSIDGQVLVMTGRWYSRQPLTNHE